MSEDGHLPPKSSVKRWLVTTNHKDIGVLYLVTSLFFLVFGGILALLIRAQMWSSGPLLLDGLGYNQVVSAHGLLMVFWFISPFALGLGNYVVPLQIGAEDLAFPRLNALSYWVYLASGVLFGLSFFLGSTFSGGWTMYAPLNVPTFVPKVAQVGSTAAILALVLFVASVTVGSVNFLTTFYRMRAKGLRMRDIPMFSFSILLTIWMMLFAFAALLAALMILASDHIIGTTYFANEAGGAMLWTHLFWFFGHPEVYIVFFPALGIMAEVFQTFSGKRLVGRKWFILAMVLVALQSFVVWMHHMFLTGINLEVKTIFMATTIGISLPFDLMMFSLIYTMVKGKIRFTTPFLFCLGSVLLFIIGGITGVFLGAVILDYTFRGTYWVVAHFHYVMVGGATALFGGLYYWFPKMTGKMYDERLGKIHFVTYFVGFNLLYFPMFVVWETPRRWFHYDGVISVLGNDLTFQLFHRMATVGAFLLAASFLLFFYNLFTSLWHGEEAGDNPWEYASTIEWSVPSPPPIENFPKGVPSYASGKLEFLSDDEVAQVERSASTGHGSATAADGGAAADGGTADVGTADASLATTSGATAPATAEATQLETAHADDHPDHASYWPLFIGISALVTFLGLSGLSADYFVWPFLFAGAFFVAYVGFEGARRDGFAWVHGALGVMGVIMAGVTVQLLAIDKGGLGTALSGTSPYFWVTLVGGCIGGASLLAMGFESFYSPEPAIAERYPFSAVGKTKLGMWVFLASDIVLFGAFIGSYLFMRVANGWQDWHHLYPENHLVMPGLINTYLLLGSSFAIVMGLVAARRSNRKALLGWLGVTWLLSAGFLYNKAAEWISYFTLSSDHFAEGWGFTTNIASSTYYLTTGLHAVHVIVGMLIMLFLIARAYKGAYLGEEESGTVEYFGLYWHLVDIVWLFLFPLFYIL